MATSLTDMSTIAPKPEGLPKVKEDSNSSIRERFKKWINELLGICNCYKRRTGTDEDDPGSKDADDSGTDHEKPKLDNETEPRSGGSKPTSSPDMPDLDPPPAPTPSLSSLEPYTAQLQHYSVHKMRDFPPKPFKSDNYEGVYNEILKWVKPLHYHPRLQSAFLQYCLPPKVHEKLHLLSETLHELANAINTNKKQPENKHKDLVPILSELSHDNCIKLDQIKSMIIVSEAFKVFPRHIIEGCIRTLKPDKRQRLIEFICTIPYGTDKRVFSDSEDTAAFMDTELQPIMTRMGFSKPAYSSDLMWESAGTDEEDRLGAGLFLLAGSNKIY